MRKVGIRELRRLASIKMLKESMPFEIVAGGEVIANVRQGCYEDVRQANINTPEPIQIPNQPDVPFYNPSIHKPGDRVWIWQNGKQVEITVP